MSNYAKSKVAPRTMTEQEVKKFLTLTGEHEEDFRDHVIFSFALGTGLREMEILALNCGDVYDKAGKTRRRIALKRFKGSKSKKWSSTVPQDVFLPDNLKYKVEKFRRWKIAHQQPIDNDSPLFASKKSPRLSARRLRAIFVEWQTKCDFARRYRFHDLRHTMATNLWRKSRDILMVQRATRHSSVNNTTIYARPGDEELAVEVRDIDC